MDSKGFRQDLKSVRKSLKSNVKGFFNLGAAAKSFLQIVSVGAFIKLGRDALQMAAQLDAASGKLGLTTDMIQELGFAGEQFGVKSETTSMALQRFTRRLGEAQQGTGEMLPVIEQYNIKVKNMDGTMRSAEAVFRDYVDVIGQAKTPQEKLRLSFKAFDSEGVALVNVLKDGTRGLDAWAKKAQESGTIMEESTVKSLAKANNEIKNFTDSLTVAAGEIIVNFRTKEGLELMGLQFTKVITQFGTRLLDQIVNAGSNFDAVMSGAAKGVAGVLQNALIVALQVVAIEANKILPKKWKFDVSGLEALKSASQGFGAEIIRAIAMTTPSGLTAAVTDSFDRAIARQKEVATESVVAQINAGERILSAQERHQQSVFRRAEEILAKQDAANQENATALDKGAADLDAAADKIGVNLKEGAVEIVKASKKIIQGIAGGEAFNNASDEALEERLRRNQRGSTRLKSRAFGYGDIGSRMMAARLEMEAINLKNEIEFRDKFRRTVDRGGESAAFREFQNIDPLQIDALLDQFTRNRTEAERSADSIGNIETGLIRRGIIPGG